MMNLIYLVVGFGVAMGLIAIAYSISSFNLE